MKIVTAQEMALLEEGGSAENYMLQAAQEIAQVVIEFISERKLEKVVTLLVGRGNNGGDALATGIRLLSAGIQVQALCVEGPVSALNEKMRERFFAMRGKNAQKLEGVLLDGLLGTGLKGDVEPAISQIIEEANASALPIFSIDIPSGLNGTTGKATTAIRANCTIALGLPKIGFFLEDGWNYVGKLCVVDFGLPQSKLKEAHAVAELAETPALPKIERVRHKYEAGYVVGLAGSKKMPGAAKLAGLAALRCGAGLVRVFSFEELGEAPLELICNLWNEEEWKAALLKAKSVFVGPGLERAFPLKQIKQPCVIDADALTLEVPEKAILTPHKGEAKRLFVNDEAIQTFCNRTGAIVVLKGAPTKIFAKDKLPTFVAKGTPGMATAGSGDVLTGILAALLAQGMDLFDAAVLGVTLHAEAGELCAYEKTDYSMIAEDLIEALPSVFHAYLQNQSTK